MASAWLIVAGVGVARADRAPLVLVTEGQDDAAAERLRASLEGELGRSVVRGGSVAEGEEAIIVTRRSAGREVQVTYVAPGGQRLERSLRVQDDAERAEGEVALLAGNLARDESASLIAGLPSGEGAKAQAKAPAARPPEFSCKTRKGPEYALGADFVPYLGLSTLPSGRAASRRVSLNLVGGLSRGTSLFEGAGVANLDTEFVCGFQGAGAVNYVGGPVRGVQGAGAVNVALGSIEGVQGAGAVNVALGAIEGVQGAGAVNVALGSIAGVQGAGAVNFVLGPIEGLQGAGAVNVARRTVQGAQVAGAVNFAGEGVRGVQASGGANVAMGPVHGGQLGPLNVATGRVKGVQIGVINYAEDADFALGFINIFPKGRFHLDAWFVPEVGLMATAIKHGGAHFHYFYGLGMRIPDQTPWYVWGLGGHVTFGETWFLDIDALSYGRLGVKAIERNEGRGINQLRVVLGHPVTKGLSLYGGPSGNVSLAGREHGPPMYSFYQRRTAVDSNELSIYVWPGLVLGMQALLDGNLERSAGRRAQGGDTVMPALSMSLTSQRHAAERSAESDLPRPASRAEAGADGRALVEGLRRDDPAALAALYRMHHESVRAFVRRLLGDETAAEDLVQEVFVTAPRAFRNYRGEAPPRSFLLSIAVNHARHYLRAAKRRRSMVERFGQVEPEGHAEGPEGPEGAARRRALAARLTLALDELPLDQRVVVVLCEVEERTSAEVSLIVGAPEATVRTRLFHAKRKLRALLEGERDV
jgi:RNA polymerase sigma-70 factor (ECF subfamily)